MKLTFPNISKADRRTRRKRDYGQEYDRSKHKENKELISEHCVLLFQSESRFVNYRLPGAAVVVVVVVVEWQPPRPL